MTVLLVEQNAYHALKLAHRGYVLVNGQIDALRHRPRAARRPRGARGLSRRRPLRRAGMTALLGNSLAVFIGLTVVLFGGAAILTGRAIAETGGRPGRSSPPACGLPRRPLPDLRAVRAPAAAFPASLRLRCSARAGPGAARSAGRRCVTNIPWRYDRSRSSPIERAGAYRRGSSRARMQHVQSGCRCVAISTPSQSPRLRQARGAGAMAARPGQAAGSATGEAASMPASTRLCSRPRAVALGRRRRARPTSPSPRPADHRPLCRRSASR